MNNIRRNSVDHRISVYSVDAYSILSLGATIYMAVLGDRMNVLLSAIALMLFFPLITKPKYLIGPLFFATVFDDILIAFSGQSFSRFLCIYLILSTIFLSIQKRQYKLSKGSLSIILLMLMGIVFSFHGLFGYTSFPVGYIFALLQTLVLLNFYSITGEELKETLFRYAIISLLYFVYIIATNGLDALSANRTIIGGINANQVAFGVAVVGSIIFSHFCLENFQRKAIHIVLMLIAMVCIFLTGSRSGLIACVVSSILILIITFHRQNRRFSKIFVVMVVAALLLVIMYSYLTAKFPLLMSRFTISHVVDSGGTSRVAIWETYFNYYFPSHWLFGIGFDPLNMYYAVESRWIVGHGAHNIVVDVLSVSGVIGLLAYTVYFSKCIKLFSNSAKYHLNVLVPLGMLICVLVMGIGEDVIRAKMLWLCIGFGFAAINGDKREMVNEYDKQ